MVEDFGAVSRVLLLDMGLVVPLEQQESEGNCPGWGRLLMAACPVGGDDEAQEAAEEAERTRLAGMHFHKNRIEIVLGRLLTRWAIRERFGISDADYCLQRADIGKPYVTQLAGAGAGAPFWNFNLSHDSGLAALVTSDTHLVGIDVVKVSTAKSFSALRGPFLSRLSDAEIAALDRVNETGEGGGGIGMEGEHAALNLFFHIWALKEAYVKALGVGISDAKAPLRSIEFHAVAASAATLTPCEGKHEGETGFGSDGDGSGGDRIGAAVEDAALKIAGLTSPDCTRARLCVHGEEQPQWEVLVVRWPPARHAERRRCHWLSGFVLAIAAGPPAEAQDLRIFPGYRGQVGFGAASSADLPQREGDGTRLHTFAAAPDDEGAQTVDMRDRVLASLLAQSVPRLSTAVNALPPNAVVEQWVASVLADEDGSAPLYAAPQWHAVCSSHEASVRCHTWKRLCPCAQQRTSYIKILANGRRKYEQEKCALRDWVPAAGLPAPRLLAHNDQLRALLLSQCVGTTVSDLGSGLDAVTRRRIFAQAGRWLQRLHSAQFEDTDTISLEEAVGKRVASWQKRLHAVTNDATPAIHSELQPWLMRGAVACAGSRRVPCHRDFGPHNWLVALAGPAETDATGDTAGEASGKAQEEDAQGEDTECRLQFSCIDFEHSRPDHRYADIAPVFFHAPSPQDFAAFLQGYDEVSGGGSSPTGDGGVLEDPAFILFAALHALGTESWAAAAQPDDEQSAFSALAQDMWTKLLAHVRSLGASVSSTSSST